MEHTTWYQCVRAESGYPAGHLYEMRTTNCLPNDNLWHMWGRRNTEDETQMVQYMRLRAMGTDESTTMRMWELDQVC